MSDATTTAAEPARALTPDDLATADCVRAVEAVDVPEWGGRVHVRELTALERHKLDLVLYTDEGKFKFDLFRAGVVAASLCHADGRPFYAPDDLKGIHTVGSKSLEVVQRLYAVAGRLNKVRAEDAAEGKGDSGGTPAGGSPSA